MRQFNFWKKTYLNKIIPNRNNLVLYGIGLYLCRTIAEKFNAKIVGISKGEHQGAKFILVIDTHK